MIMTLRFICYTFFSCVIDLSMALGQEEEGEGPECVEHSFECVMRVKYRYD